MPSTYEPIATTTVGTATPNITFSSIPSTYTDLVLIGNIAQTSATAYQGYVYTNLGGTHSNTFIKGDGSTASSSRYTGGVGSYFAIDGVTHSSSTYGTLICHIMNYANTTTNKTNLIRYSEAGKDVEASAGLFGSTSAITSVSVGMQVSNISAGSTFTLYGIKAA